MTSGNYRELQSFCVDLLVRAGVLSWGRVNTDCSVDVEFLDHQQALAVRSMVAECCRDARVRDEILAILDAEPESKPESSGRRSRQ